jgi:hypothetical protein
VNATMDGLVRAVLMRVREQKCSMDVAYREIAAEIGGDPAALSAWWEVFGPWWVQAAYLVGQGADVNALPLFGAVAEEEAPAPARPRRAARPNWMLNLNPFDVILQVADTDRRKRVGDFDADDARAFEGMYKSKASDADRLRRRWARVAETLGEARLEDVQDRVPVLELGLFPPQYVEKVRATHGNVGAPLIEEERRAA